MITSAPQVEASGFIHPVTAAEPIGKVVVTAHCEPCNTTVDFKPDSSNSVIECLGRGTAHLVTDCPSGLSHSVKIEHIDVGVGPTYACLYQRLFEAGVRVVKWRYSDSAAA